MALSKTDIRMAEVEKHFLQEQENHPPLIGPYDVPGRPEVIPNSWYTAVLCRDCPEAEVVNVEFNWDYHGTTDGKRITITYNQAGQKANLPQHFYAKYSPSLRARLLVGINGASEGEVTFYKDLRPKVVLEAPVSYYAGFDRLSCRTFFLLEDVSVTKNARFGTAIDLYVDKKMAQSMLTQMASYHAYYWGADIKGFSYPDVLGFQQGFNEALRYDELYDIGFRLAEHVIPTEIFNRLGDISRATMRSLEINVSNTPTLLHHDTHLGNWYVTQEGEMGLVDWQCIATGQWALDVAYALSIALSTEDRRAWEAELIRFYVDRLYENGIREVTVEDAWLAYRQQMFHGFCWWVGTLGSAERDGHPMPRDIIILNIQRTAQALSDLDSFDAIK